MSELNKAACWLPTLPRVVCSDSDSRGRFSSTRLCSKEIEENTLNKCTTSYFVWLNVYQNVPASSSTYDFKLIRFRGFELPHEAFEKLTLSRYVHIQIIYSQSINSLRFKGAPNEGYQRSRTSSALSKSSMSRTNDRARSENDRSVRN